MVNIKSARNLLTAALIAASALAAVVIPQASSASVGISVQLAPPAPRFERVPSARRGYIWVPGYWDWRGHRHHWVRGTWVRERRGYHYQPHRWVERNGGWYMDRGRWDRDGDGVPDYRDRHPNNPRR